MSQTTTTIVSEPILRRAHPNEPSRNEVNGGITLATFQDQQSKVLPHKKLMIVFPTIALAQMISYLDQTSVSTALPAIGSDLNLGPSISWVAASFLLASTSIQLVNGRLSDIFGRKPLLLICMSMLAVGNLGAGFSTNAGMLFTFRTLSGLGGGAINALVMIISSDITTLEQRGKYNGFIGCTVALGNGLGPLIGGALTEKASWRWTFWFLVPVIAAVMILLYIVIPPSKVQGNTWAKFKMIDWVGLMINIAAVLLVLIPISEGGTIYPWHSALVIAMLTIGILLVISFVVVEWKFSPLPLMPMRLFQSDMSANLIFIQGTLYGVVYWANLFYVPLYLQNIRGYSPVISGAIILPMVASHGIGSIISGQIISRTGHYNPVMITANFTWLIGVSLQILYSRTFPIWAVCVIGFLQGIGIGCVFQPGLVALLAHSRKADRAVANSLRNFLRTMGGSIGLTISGAILNNTLRSSLKGVVSDGTINQLTSSVYSLSTLNLTPTQHEQVLDAYMKGMHYIFIMYAPIIGLCALAGVCIRDNGVAEKDAKKEDMVPMTATSRAKP